MHAGPDIAADNRGQAPRGRWLAAPTVAVLGLAALASMIVFWSSYFGCAYTQVEATAGGQGPESCVREFVPQVLFQLAPLLVLGAAVVVGKPWLAWANVLLNLLAAAFFQMSSQAVQVVLAALLAVALGWWHLSRRHVARPRLRPFVLASAILLIALALLAFAVEASSFFDPCHEWGQGRQPGEVVESQPDVECPSRSASSETRGEAATRLAIVSGTPVFLSTVAIASHRKGGMLIGCGGVLAAWGLFLMWGFSTAFMVAWPIAALWIAAGLEHRSQLGSRAAIDAA